MKTGHISIPVEVCLKRLRQGVNMFDDQVSEEEAWAELDRLKAAGVKYISGCDNTDDNGLCKCDKEVSENGNRN